MHCTLLLLFIFEGSLHCVLRSIDKHGVINLSVKIAFSILLSCLQLQMRLKNLSKQKGVLDGNIYLISVKLHS